jgi:hypothetical protein
VAKSVRLWKRRESAFWDNVEEPHKLFLFRYKKALTKTY